MNVEIERRGLVRNRPGTARSERVYVWQAAVRCIFSALLPRKKLKGVESSNGKSTPLISEIASYLHSPNKALEPTLTIGPFFESDICAQSSSLLWVSVAHL